MSGEATRSPGPSGAAAVASAPGLPMPRDLAMVLDPAQRPRVRRSDGRRFPFPIPNGWFTVAAAADLGPGDVRPLDVFGRELVLFRTESGAPRLVDSYCAHLGANLAVGGKVDGEGIRCPFHGWCYDGTSGRCIDIPYAESEHIPSKAQVRAFPMLERNGMIWAWHHLDGGEPFYDVPVVPEFDDPEWSEPVTRAFVVNTCCQEMAENNHDFAHFKFVHGGEDIPWETEELIADSPYKKTSSPTGFVRETFGLGLGVLRKPGRFVFLSSTTPFDEESVLVRWTFVTPREAGDGAAATLADVFLEAVSQDIPIWENKAYRERPVLTKEESGILDYRRWAQQFYSQPAGSA